MDDTIMTSLAPRPEVMNVSLVPHGGWVAGSLNSAEGDPPELLDFSANINAYGPSPAVLEALAKTPVDRYPDPEAMELRQVLAEKLAVKPSNLIVGNGSVELIWLIALAYVRPNDAVFVLGPTFGEYARAAQLMGATVQTWTAEPSTEFEVASEQVLEVLDRLKPRVAFVCNPNNPTGRLVEPEVVKAWVTLHPATLFVVDEAYLAFASPARSTLSWGCESIVSLRSMTKDYALAGLRLGYAVGSEKVMEALARVRPPWSVNMLAQAAGIAALQDDEHLRHSLRQLAEEKKSIVAALRVMGGKVVPSSVHFFLLQVRDSGTFRAALMEESIVVRECSSFDLPQFVRICTRRPEENARLLEAIARHADLMVRSG